VSAQTIYKALRAAGLTAAGACGLMGNMQAESAMRANNLQDSYAKAWGISEAEYCALVNAGKPTHNGKMFWEDGAGFGFCQWTSGDRKRGLYTVAIEQWGTTIEDPEVQVWFCCHELRTQYTGLWNYLCSDSCDLMTAVSRICKEFERPAVNNVDDRAGFAKAFYEALAAGGAESEAAVGQDGLKDELTNETVMHLQAILTAYGYELGTSKCSSGVDGLIGKKTVTALKDFAARLEAMV